MDYIDITSENAQRLKLVTNLENLQDATVWTFTKEGNDDSNAVMTSPSNNCFVSSFNYYQILTIDLFSEDNRELFDDKSQYTVEGISNGKVIYRGKVLTTTQDTASFTINENKYKEKTSTNNYTILD